jgi:NADH-quinone oxidoreductase subunit L
MFLIFSTFGTLDFEHLRQIIATVQQSGAITGGPVITAMCLLLFVGCMGKSAQIPLYVWLPDAMAGPTPVSALIHAATMVTSGIYLVSRLNFLYSLSPDAMHVVAIIGAATAFFAATIAIAQKDIKKILAYSTVSQLGYMFLACGVGAYTAGVFHVITHAFFKALMFLGAGSVIHGMHEEQNIWKMGGLKSKMPITFATFFVGWIAICGLPPFSGFFSKDEILWKSFSSPNGNAVLWALGALTAVITAFYMTRLFSLTFFGAPRFDEKNMGAHHEPGDDHGHDDNHGHEAPKGVHESPLTMTLPLMILAVLSAVGGFIGFPHHNWLESWLEPVIPANEALVAGMSANMEYILMGVSVAGALLGLIVGLQLYKDLKMVKKLESQFSFLHKLLENKWYIDEIYNALIVQPIKAFSTFLWKGFDNLVIDRIVLGFGRVSSWSGETARVVQNGSIQLYALLLVIGIIASVGYLIYGLV